MTTSIENRPTPPLEPPPRPQKAGVAIAAAIVIVLVIGLPVLLFQLAGNDDEPGDPVSGPTTTTMGVTSTIDPTDTATTVPSSTEAPTTVTTTEAPETSTTVVAVSPFEGALAVIATPNGIAPYGPDGSEPVVLIDGGASAVFPDRTGGVVYMAGDTIYRLAVGASEPEVVMQAQDEFIELVDVVDFDGRPHVAYTVTTGATEDTRQRLFLLDLESGITIDVAQTGGVESGLIAVSVDGSTVVTQVAGEGGVFTTAYLPGEDRVVELANGPAAECWNEFDTAAVCPWYVHIADNGARYVWIDWNGSLDWASDLVTTDAASGAEIHRVPLGVIFPRSIDVEWPLVVVNRTAITTDRYDVATPLLINLSESEGFPLELPTTGLAGVWFAR